MNFIVGVSNSNSNSNSKSVNELNSILNAFVRVEVQKEDIATNFKTAFGPIFTKL